MSHVVKCEIEIMDLDALHVTAEKLGGEYLPNETKVRWYGRYMNDYDGADAAYHYGIDPSRYGTSDAGIIRFKNASYDVAVYRVPGQDGKFCLVYDDWQQGMGIEKICGTALVNLKTRYGAEVATKQLRKKGFSVKEELHPTTNRLRLVATRSKF